MDKSKYKLGQWEDIEEDVTLQALKEVKEIKQGLTPIAVHSIKNIKGSEIDDEEVRRSLKERSDKTYQKYKEKLGKSK